MKQKELKRKTQGNVMKNRIYCLFNRIKLNITV